MQRRLRTRSRLEKLSINVSRPSNPNFGGRKPYGGSVSVLATTDLVATIMVWMIVVVVLNEVEVNVDGKTVVITLFLRVR